MKVIQAIYGEVDNAHDLRKHSVATPEELLIINKVRLKTSLIDNPPVGTEWQPFIRAFAAEGKFVVARVFPDFKAPRKDMVLTHALFLPIDQFCNEGDLGDAISLLMVDSNQICELDMLELNRFARPLSTVAAPARHSALIQVLTQSDNNIPPIWVGQDGFDNAIVHLWRYLPVGMRRSFEVNLVFTKSNLDNRRFTVVVTPADCASYWPVGYRLIRVSDKPAFVSASMGYLMGEKTGEPLRLLQAEMDLSDVSLRTLRQLEYVHTYLELAAAGETGALLDCARQVAACAPLPSTATTFKSRLLDRLQMEIAFGGRSAIWAVRNLPLEPFATGADFLKDAIFGWAAQQLSPSETSISSSEASKAILEALTKNEPKDNPEWKTYFREAFVSLFGDWKQDHAGIIWSWWSSTPGSVFEIGSLLPNLTRIEADLSRLCPSEIDKTLGAEVLAFSRLRSWYRLHACAASAHLEPMIAIRQHLAYDQRIDEVDALRDLAGRLSPDQVIDAYLTMSDNRLLCLAVECLIANPRLLSNLDVRVPKWRSLWLVGIQRGLGVFTGLTDKQRALYLLLDELVGAEPIDDDLLAAISRESNFIDLSNYPRRDEVLVILPRHVRDRFIMATASAWIGSFEKSASTVCPGGLVEVKVTSELFVREWMLGSRRKSDTVIAFFQRFNNISNADALFADWIRNCSGVTTTEAYSAGTLIEARSWRKSAAVLVDRAKLISNWGAGIDCCKPLLSAFGRLALKLTGHDSTVSSDDWWGALADIATELFPGGLEDRSIWKQAGGDTSVIRLSAPGRTQWAEAIRTLQFTGSSGVHVETLLQKMLGEYPANPVLRDLDYIWKIKKLTWLG